MQTVLFGIWTLIAVSITYDDDHYMTSMSLSSTLSLSFSLSLSLSIYIYIHIYIYVCVCVYSIYIYIYVFNKIPDFFVQAFKIVVDSWKFSMLLLYIILDYRPIFRISASNEQLLQELEYTLIKSVRDDERCGRSKEVNTPELIRQRVRVTMLRF